MTHYKLSEGSLKAIMNEEEINEPLMQINEIKQLPSSSADKERYRILLSDGLNSISLAVLSTQINSGGVEIHSVIKLKKYLTSKINVHYGERKVLLIFDMELIAHGKSVGGVIGNPIPLKDVNQPSNPQPATTTVVTSSSLSSSLFKTESNPEPTTTTVASPSSSSNFPFKTESSSSVMSRSSSEAKINPISSLTPYHRKWVIKVRVVNKSDMRTWSYYSNNQGKHFSVDLMDHTGEIRCTAFRELADKYYHRLQVDKVYYLSKCLVKPATSFNNLKNDYEMAFTNETVIEECSTNDGDVPQVKFKFVPIDQIGGMEVEALVDVIGVCKSATDIMTLLSRTTNKELKKREVQLVDQSNAAIALTLWDSRAESFDGSNNPVVVIKAAKVCEFGGGKYLSTPQNSRLIINPDIPECHSIKGWFYREGKQADVKNLSERRTGLGSIQTPWMSFRDIQKMKQNIKQKEYYYWQTMATILFIKSENAIYKACPNLRCNKKIVVLDNGMYRCEKCNREYPNFKYKLQVSMNLTDSTSNQWVSLFGDEAEKVLGKTSEEIAHALANDKEVADNIFFDANFKQFIFKCRTNVEVYSDEERLHTVVVKVLPINYEEHNAHLVERIERYLV